MKKSGCKQFAVILVGSVFFLALIILLIWYSVPGRNKFIEPTNAPTVTRTPVQKSPEPKYTVEFTPERQTAQIIASWSVSVWENPDYEGYPVAWVYTGAEITVSGCEGEWAYIGIGWVKSEWLEPDYCN